MESNDSKVESNDSPEVPDRGDRLMEKNSIEKQKYIYSYVPVNEVISSFGEISRELKNLKFIQKRRRKKKRKKRRHKLFLRPYK